MEYMELALEEAKKAYKNGEVPVGAVIVKNGEVIAKAYNMKESLKCASAHAEILAIQEAGKVIGDWRLNGTEMYVTLEPCSMCASAIAQSRISNLYIGYFNKDMGACGSVLNLFDYDIFNSRVNVFWTYNQSCGDIMAKFFSERRKDDSLSNMLL